MTSALSHRGGIEWIDDAPGAGDGAACVALDSALNDHARVSESWPSMSDDPARFVSRLTGAFALAALDRRRGRLLLARDRLGEKPLYYALTPDGAVFASEIKALLAAGVVPDRSLLPEAVDAYLAFNYVPAPWTAFRAVRKVPAGHYVTIEGGSATVARYWDLPAREGATAAPDHLLGLLSAALRRRCPPDGRVACFLSGGLDSSVVAALLARDRDPGRGRLPTFSAAFADAGYDESSHARRVAALLGTDHHEIRLRDVDPDLVARVVAQLDEPMADAACIPTWALAREAAGAAPVAMTGDGADALLAGDHWFRRLALLDRLERLPRAARRLLPAAMAIGGRRRSRRYRDLVGLLDLPRPDRYLRIRLKWTREERRAVYADAFLATLDVSAADATYREAPVEWRPGESVDAGLRLDAMHGLPEDLLMKADKMGSANGVESRSPFLDESVVEWAARLDIGLLLRGSTAKWILKEAAVALLPRDLVHRRKHGLQTPIGRWMRGPLRDLVEAAFEPGLIERQRIFDASGLAPLKRRFDGGDPAPALAGRIWQIVAFQTWWRQVFEGSRDVSGAA